MKKSHILLFFSNLVISKLLSTIIVGNSDSTLIHTLIHFLIMTGRIV